MSVFSCDSRCCLGTPHLRCNSVYLHYVGAHLASPSLHTSVPFPSAPSRRPAAEVGAQPNGGSQVGNRPPPSALATPVPRPGTDDWRCCPVMAPRASRQPWLSHPRASAVLTPALPPLRVCAPDLSLAEQAASAASILTHFLWPLTHLLAALSRFVPGLLAFGGQVQLPMQKLLLQTGSRARASISQQPTASSRKARLPSPGS